MIFVDADAYIALKVEKDFHHKKSILFLNTITSSQEKLATSWMVVNEVATKLAMFTTKSKSLEFLDELLSSDTEIIYVNERIRGSILKFFKKQTSKKVSLTDCTNMAIMKSMKIKKIFSFDKHYEKNGFELLK